MDVSIKINSNAVNYLDPQYYLILHGEKGITKEFLVNNYILSPRIGIATRGQELTKEKTYTSKLIFLDDYGEIKRR